MATQDATALSKQRLLSLDMFRGMAMVMMLMEYSHINYVLIGIFSNKPVLGGLVAHLQHYKWNGLYFWDLGQPYFTFVLGVAMAFSITNRWQKGAAWSETFKHVIYRCFVLSLLGIILISDLRGQLTVELWNILFVLSFNIIVTFLIFKFRSSTQLIISFGLLIVYDAMFRLISIDGFDQPYVKGHNLGSYVDLMLMGKTHPDGWITLNYIPTTVHAIWGVLTGKMLMSPLSQERKLKIISLTGIIAIAAGYGMDWSGIIPINKHISTSSFIIATGGFCLITFAVFYWLIDIMGYKRWTLLFTVVGMNPIFIYVFSSTIGRKWLNEFTPIFVKGIMGPFVESTGIIDGLSTFLALSFEWYLCYWLYKRKIFIKI